ncbi:MAG TPA: chromosomal replication initiator protein DnaA [Chlamydiales bacterium]|nr:chromosomal replication initiator protein DnaA [Chlamydiales bacterium]
MLICNEQNLWTEFLQIVQKRTSTAAYQNWLAPIKCLELTDEKLILQVPNIFVEKYLIENYADDLKTLFPCDDKGNLAIEFVVNAPQKKIVSPSPTPTPTQPKNEFSKFQFNNQYTFENFIEGPSNQFVKSAALGVAARPGKSFNPLFIHGGVGLGKTHLLHGIGHYIYSSKKKIKIQCITTEAFINDLVSSLKDKTLNKMKQYYRSLDVLLVDDIQFLQNRGNFEEEFCNTFEALINQGKQIVITSDKPPSQLKLSERIIARMEWGLVAHINVPEVETRVAIIQHKAKIKGFQIPTDVAFFIADHMYDNVRQIEGAINRLAAYSRLMHKPISIDFAENLLKGMLDFTPKQAVSVESILKNVSTVFNIKVSDIKGDSRQKEIAKARQVAMFLAKELISESLSKIAISFGGKTHSTLLHAWKKISTEIKENDLLNRQIQMIKRNLAS